MHETLDDESFCGMCCHLPHMSPFVRLCGSLTLFRVFLVSILYPTASLDWLLTSHRASEQQFMIFVTGWVTSRQLLPTCMTCARVTSAASSTNGQPIQR